MSNASILEKQPCNVAADSSLHACGLDIVVAEKAHTFMLQRSAPARSRPLLQPEHLGGLELAALPGRVQKTGNSTVICVSPDQWLIRSADTLYEAFDSILEGYSIEDMSSQYIYFDIQGSAAEDFLSKGSSVDFQKDSFLKGNAVRTLFAQTTVVIEKLDEQPKFRLLVDVSYVGYIWKWFSVTVSDMEKQATAE